MITKREALQRISDEYDRAMGIYGEFESTHEGLAVIWEEFEELKRGVFKRDNTDVLDEATHLGAMALKMMTFCSRFNLGRSE